MRVALSPVNTSRREGAWHPISLLRPLAPLATCTPTLRWARAAGARPRRHDRHQVGHRTRVEAAGPTWRRMRPEMPDYPGLEAEFMDPRTGSEILFRRLVAPAVADSYADLQAATRAADLRVSTPLFIAAPLLAETAGLPWISALLQPMGFFSAYDFPVLSGAQRLTAALHSLGPLVGRPMRDSPERRPVHGVSRFASCVEPWACLSPGRTRRPRDRIRPPWSWRCFPDFFPTPARLAATCPHHRPALLGRGRGDWKAAPGSRSIPCRRPAPHRVHPWLGRGTPPGGSMPTASPPPWRSDGERSFWWERLPPTSPSCRTHCRRNARSAVRSARAGVRGIRGDRASGR